MTNQKVPQDEEVVEITEAEFKEYEEAKVLRNAIFKLKKNKDFKLFMKNYIDKSLVTLGLNLGVQPQMRGELNLQIEARRILNDFIDQAITYGNNAEEVLNGVQ